MNQEVPLYLLTENSWNTIYLLNPILVDGTKELWFGIVAYTNGNNGHVVRVGSSTYKANKGGILGYFYGPYSDTISYDWTDMANVGNADRCISGSIYGYGVTGAP